MDPSRFDTLVRSLTKTRSRRGALATLLGGTLGLLGLADTAAKRKGKRKRKKRDRNPSPPPPPPGSCANGIKNGSESDVDCGGSCPRCANGKSCLSRDDCASARCVGATCQECTAAAECGNDSDGTMCACRTNAATQRVCTKINGRFIAGGSCANCQAGEQCVLPPGGAECLLPCGTPTG